ncbi:hypothetical protein [Nocardioides pinisoli]|uniref:Uncharacterized protein n=1 Tax=Nocardioides pinisoli TaxID=2950279 RepID=A0ABT1KRW3_9ACTN|nr:hypothetical protein [Nocardioides pinisoli]MCP3420481.1 hypothetical protein [Nocardioides pinisoli]
MTSHPHDAGQDPAGDPDQFLAFTHDQASAARLRANLVSIAERHPDTGVASIVGEVLAGRRPIRDLADDPEFSAVIAVGMDDYRSYLASLTPDERAEMVASAKDSASGAERGPTAEKMD